MFQKQPTVLDGVLRQPLYGNPLIIEAKNTPLGMGPNQGLHLWSRVGIQQVAHLWDSDTQDWLSMEQIQAKLPRKGAVTEKGRSRRIKTISHVPWDPRDFPLRDNTAWLHDTGSSTFYFCSDTTRGGVMTKYTLDKKKGLLTESEDLSGQPAPHSELARVVV